MTWERPINVLSERERQNWKKDCIESIQNDKLFFTLLTIEYFERGIAPLYFTHDNMNKVLSALPPEEAERMRRKFRKVWRRIARERVRESRQHKREMRKKDLRPYPRAVTRKSMHMEPINGFDDPLKFQQQQRKYVVKAYIEAKATQRVQMIKQEKYNGMVMVTRVPDTTDEGMGYDDDVK